ncbi:hypothetical protein HG531_009112 [Fusarium graminearum]|nr:hypothetical protein HG531_009112 [Fusarium graminearum]
MASDETTPLLPSKGEGKKSNWLRNVCHVENRILLAGFLITLAFSFTQVPLFYVFHLMSCDSFYDSHPPYDGPGDRCSRDEIASMTATQFSILGMSTTFCGTLNLFLAGWIAKRFGPRAALLMQIFIPAIRVVTQILGVLTGKREGMLIIQMTQLITIFGGPSGYILVINIIAGEVVEPLRRTAVFGRLQGAIMLGQGIGYLTGGMLGDIDIKAPFGTSFCCFILSGIYAWSALPYISPESMSSGGRPATGFLTPLKVLMPQKLRLANGKTKKHLGVIFLCAGIFLGVLATDYAPLLIQMYATAAFSFTQGDNGWLMSEFAIMRSFFLIFLFPRIITWGRSWYVNSRTTSSDEVDETITQHIPTTAGEFDATVGEQADHEPYQAVNSNKEDEGVRFDLVFLRWSLVVDGLLTTVSGFATQRWHIYLAAFLLPFGSGSAPAAKGCITQMCPDSQRADALNAVTLVENIARLATQGLFGLIFATLAQAGKAYATFFCNAAIAIVAMGVLLFSNFPPPGSTLIDKNGGENEEQPGDQDNEPLLNERECRLGTRLNIHNIPSVRRRGYQSWPLFLQLLELLLSIPNPWRVRGKQQVHLLERALVTLRRVLADLGKHDRTKKSEPSVADGPSKDTKCVSFGSDLEWEDLSGMKTNAAAAAPYEFALAISPASLASWPSLEKAAARNIAIPWPTAPQ